MRAEWNIRLICKNVHKRCSTVWRKSVVCSAAIAVFPFLSVAAQTLEQIPLSIEAQPLSEALTSLADQLDKQIVFYASDVGEKQGLALEGMHTEEEALRLLLADTGLRFHFINDRTIAVTPNDRQFVVQESEQNADGRSAAATSPGADEKESRRLSVQRGRAKNKPTERDHIIVVGSRIIGTQMSGVLPVTVLGREEIESTGAVSGQELFLAIPQIGDVNFNQTVGQVSSAFARGDVASIDIRGLGVGNTLSLVNGRRGVRYPSSQASSNLAPVLTFNSNTIPVNGVDRVEVLRDGAGAIYGSDAVAGVVNTVLQSDYDGVRLDVQYGGAPGTNLRETTLNGLLGKSFHDDRGNVTLFANYTGRTALRSGDQSFTASTDKRPLFAGTVFEGNTQLRNTSTTTPFGVFETVGAMPVSQGGAALTSLSGIFHLQPTTNAGCLSDTAQAGLCIDDGVASTGGADENLRYDRLAVLPISVLPDLKRLNLFALGQYRLNDHLELFGEGAYYRAKTESLQDSIFTIGSIRMTIPASNYWNPFGPTTFADGTPNPNRLPGIDAPAEGLPLVLRKLRLSDLGPTNVRVTAGQFRGLIGLRGKALGIDWESALLYSEATVDDRQEGIDATLFQQNLGLSTPDAFNPFNGGDPINPMGPDTTFSSQTSLDAIRIEANRKNKTTLFQWDLRLSRLDLMRIWAGDVGIAAGVEFRRETQLDDRDPNVDGTNLFFDSVLGVTQDSNLFGVSPTPDNFGAREVTSAYIETAVPLISPEMGVPLVRSLVLQLAGRFEHYSDFGSVAKPKVAFGWDLTDSFRIRGSYSQGFRAPNLEQVNASIITRGNSRVDFIRCEADLRAGRIASFSDCDADVIATSRRAGNPDLEPETSENYTIGAVLRPQFAPEALGDFSLTVDYWSIDQQGIVGVFGGGNALALDYLNRIEGSGNLNVIRDAPTADDIAQFAGTGLDPVGEVRFVNDQFRNLAPQRAEGIDLGLLWELDSATAGRFSASFNAAHLLTFSRGVLDGIDTLLDARDAGVINAGTVLPDAANLIQRNGNPKWRLSTSLTWSLRQLRIGAHARYVGGVFDTSLLDGAGNPFLTDSHTVVNLFGEYTFEQGLLGDTRVRVGARNLFDNQPPRADETFGFIGRLHSPVGRYLYVNVKKAF